MTARGLSSQAHSHAGGVWLPPDSDIPEYLENSEATPDPAYEDKSGRASWKGAGGGGSQH